MKASLKVMGLLKVTELPHFPKKVMVKKIEVKDSYSTLSLQWSDNRLGRYHNSRAF